MLLWLCDYGTPNPIPPLPDADLVPRHGRFLLDKSPIRWTDPMQASKCLNSPMFAVFPQLRYVSGRRSTSQTAEPFAEEHDPLQKFDACRSFLMFTRGSGLPPVGGEAR
jgi:hypothetical protein